MCLKSEKWKCGNRHKAIYNSAKDPLNKSMVVHNDSKKQLVELKLPHLHKRRTSTVLPSSAGLRRSLDNPPQPSNSRQRRRCTTAPPSLCRGCLPTCSFFFRRRCRPSQTTSSSPSFSSTSSTDGGLFCSGWVASLLRAFLLLSKSKTSPQCGASSLRHHLMGVAYCLCHHFLVPQEDTTEQPDEIRLPEEPWVLPPAGVPPGLHAFEDVGVEWDKS